MSAVDTEWMGSQDTHVEVKLTKVVAAFLGMTLILASIGLWILPETSGSPAMTMIKIGLSVLEFMGGMVLLFSSRTEM